MRHSWIKYLGETTRGPFCKHSRVVSHKAGLLALTLFLVSVGVCHQSHAKDWPTYRADNQRSGATAESLDLPLQLQWTYQAHVPPSPAWQSPARSSIWQRLDRIQPRVDDDRVFHPIAVGDHVYFASSSDDQVTCLHRDDGRVVWRFFTDGPIRYAPTVADNHLFVGSDDGYIYCLDSAQGRMLWRQRIAPQDRRIPGNGRLISTWPVRTGVLVQDNIAYCAAGLFPSQGVYTAAFRTRDGTPLYRTEIQESPEGQLLMGHGELYAPTGRGSPIAINAKTGEVVRQYSGVNGTFALVVENQLVARNHEDAAMQSIPTTARVKFAHFPGRQMVVAEDVSYLLSDTEIVAVHRTRLLALTAERISLEKSLVQQRKALTGLDPESPGAQTARESLRVASQRMSEIQDGLAACERWRIPATGLESLVVAGSHVVAGGQSRVTAMDRATGRHVWGHEIKGRALGLAIANGGLIVSTDQGQLSYFRNTPGKAVAGTISRSPAPPTPVSLSPSSAHQKRLQTILDRIQGTPEARQGYAIIVDSISTELARILVEKTALRITLVERSLDQATARRQELSEAGLYGPRLNVLVWASDSLPFTDGFANVVVDERALDQRPDRHWQESELRRVLRPFGALAWWTASLEPFQSPPELHTGSWTHLYANTANTASTEDRTVHADLALQWFGGPGPQAMTDRHLRATAPLASHGRMILVGENQLIGVDAFNGTEWWQRTIPKLSRYSIPYDSGYVALDETTVYAGVENQLWLLDSATGDIRSRLEPPSRPKNQPSHWGYVGVTQDSLFGSTQSTNASHREATYQAVDDAYRSQQPMVTSDQLFCLARPSHRLAWTYHNGAILNATITITQDGVYFFENRSPQNRHRAGERIRLPDVTNPTNEFFLVCLDPRSGQKRWDRSLDLTACDNILYLSASHDGLVIVGSGVDANQDAQYHVRVLKAADGSDRWMASHSNRKRGELGHGEQVHHPVILGNRLVTEPVFYDLESGHPYNPDGQSGHWPIVRPGHSCGTMSGAGDALFFRANNPTVLNLEASAAQGSRFKRLAPSRPGCWINIIPANGLVLLPEASAGCVCNYSIQSSMAFRPRKR